LELWLIGGVVVSLVCWWLLMVVKLVEMLGIMVVVADEMRSVMEFA
jgi:hypothetical protein